MRIPCLLVLACASITLAADPFAEMVRKTEPLPPSEQAKTFHLPDGFEIELIAAEPDIGKPMNLAFDSRGRLWVTSTHLYPYPAKAEDEKKDTIKVIAFGDGGKVASITTFADKLDIPVGVYPITNGDKAIAFDIASVCLYTDSDGDGKSDQRDALYTGWGYQRDTHGMASNFRRHYDGWLYGCHGFNNISDIKGKDGQVLHLQSGNTYRMRLDGSHIEAFTIGQINPFGMSIDPLGNIYTSDSHSKPIYQNLRGGRYEAFDRNTDDGLGLAPMAMTHLHGSTAIAGSCFYADDKFPEEFRGNVFVGNVMTCRINRDKLQYIGSTPKAIEQPDFLTTDDPWFRPVQTILGPDGAIYVADFYNRIIGHYEVKLDHPGRDYDRGRIWRITYKGKRDAKFDISKADVKELIAKFDDPNISVRLHALSEVSDRIGSNAIAPLTELLESGKASPAQKVGALWSLYRLGSSPDHAIVAAASDSSASVRTHVMRILSETIPWTGEQRDLALKGLSDSDALVARCAADALGQHPQPQNVRALLDALKSNEKADTHRVYVTRMALRNQLRANESFAKLDKLNDDDLHTLADIAIGIQTPDAAAFLLANVQPLSSDKQALVRYLKHAVRFATSPDVGPLAAVMKEKFAGDIDLQLELYDSVRQGMQQRGQELTGSALEWGKSMVQLVLSQDLADVAWTSGADAPSPWAYESRRCSDGRPAMLLSSLPGGEQTTSVLKSKPFKVPAKLTFQLAGHNAPPDQVSPPKNFARLRAANSNEVLAEALPPRNDQAKKITWDLKKYEGREGYLEFTDGDTGTGYAWLAFGKLDPQVVPMPRVGLRTLQQQLRQAAESAGQMKLPSASPNLRRLMTSRMNDVDTRAAAAGALALMHDEASIEPMKALVANDSEPMALRQKIASAMGTMGADVAMIELFKTVPAELQTALATALASNVKTANALVDAVGSPGTELEFAL